MQRGHVYIHGTGCPSTHNGQHLVELPDEDEADRQKPGWCRMCALEFPRLEIENELLREALTWAVGYLRGHVNAETYPDFHNAAKLVDGEQAVHYGHFQTVQNLWEHVERQEKEIATLTRQVRDQQGWMAIYNSNSGRIGKALEPIRQKRQTGEPARPDWVEVVELARRVGGLEGIIRDRVAPLLPDAVRDALVLSAQELATRTVGRLADCQLRVKDLEEFVRDINSNHDHDEDAHRYKTLCYVCEAEKLLPKKEGA